MQNKLFQNIFILACVMMNRRPVYLGPIGSSRSAEHARKKGRIFQNNHFYKWWAKPATFMHSRSGPKRRPLCREAIHKAHPAWRQACLLAAFRNNQLNSKPAGRESVHVRPTNEQYRTGKPMQAGQIMACMSRWAKILFPSTSRPGHLPIYMQQPAGLDPETK
jgi:hypothetical protein